MKKPQPAPTLEKFSISPKTLNPPLKNVQLPWSNLKNSFHEKISIPPLQKQFKPSRKNLNLPENFLPPFPLPAKIA